MKNLLVILSLALLIGCGGKHVVREAYPVPLPYVPAIPDVQRPVIDADTVVIPLDLTKATDEEKGALIKAYRLSAESWKQYAEELEQIVNELRGIREEVKPITDNLIKTISEINKDAAADLQSIESKDVE